MEKGKVPGNDVCLQGGHHNPGSQDLSARALGKHADAGQCMEAKETAPGCEEGGEPLLRSTQNITLWASARTCKDRGCTNVTWQRKDSPLAR